MILLRSAVLILLLWAGIYLPGLGLLPLKGEEGRRVLPGLAMLDSGDWLLPTVGGEEYHRKPPLVNWLAALSVQVTGERSEWAVRLPSVMAVMVLGMVVWWSSRGWLGERGALAASIFCLTNIGLMEKGRLIEIEGLYIALYGIAIALWIAACAGRRSAWAMWLAPAIFLGLGMLAKGPVHLLFFYAVAVPVLAYSGQVRRLWHPAHFLSLVVIAGLFGAWAWPMMQVAEGGEAAATWTDQLAERIGIGDFELGSWAMDLVRGLVNYLPWTCLLVVAWTRVGRAGRDHPAAERGIKVGLVVGYLCVMLLPGALARYTLPLLVPASLLVAAWWCGPEGWVPRGVPVAWRACNLWIARMGVVGAIAVPLVGGFGWEKVVYGVIAVGLCGWVACRRCGPREEIGSGAIMVALSLIYAGAVLPEIAARPGYRTQAQTVEARVPATGELWMYDPDYQPIIFYLPHEIRYALKLSELPGEVGAVIVRKRHVERVQERPGWEGCEVVELPEKGARSANDPVLLLKVGG
jgi:4-amino-4-deoxy-L-arabinose transferase-like glycosyltransferase